MIHKETDNGLSRTAAGIAGAVIVIGMGSGLRSRESPG